MKLQRCARTQCCSSLCAQPSRSQATQPVRGCRARKAKGPHPLNTAATRHAHVAASAAAQPRPAHAIAAELKGHCSYPHPGAHRGRNCPPQQTLQHLGGVRPHDGAAGGAGWPYAAACRAAAGLMAGRAARQVRTGGQCRSKPLFRNAQVYHDRDSVTRVLANDRVMPS